MSILSTAFSAVSAPIQPYLLAIKIALIAGAIGTIIFLGWRVHADGLALGADNYALKQAQITNAENTKTISALHAANVAWSAADAANKEQIDELNSTLVSQANTLVVSRRTLTQQQAAEVLPQQVAIRDTRIDIADAALAQRLRAESSANAR